MLCTDLLNKSFKLKNPPCIAETIENEIVIINLDKGNYYNLQSQSAQIWQALNDGVSPNSLILANHWDSLTVQALKKFINTAIEEEIIEIIEASPGKADIPKITIDNPETDISISVFTDMQELLSLDPIHETHDTVGWPEKK